VISDDIGHLNILMLSTASAWQDSFNIVSCVLPILGAEGIEPFVHDAIVKVETNEASVVVHNVKV